MLGAVQDIDIKLLRTFVTVARVGGFSAAQAELNTSQSSISTSMSQLESRLGVRLCERGMKGFRLTDEGERVLQAAERLLEDLDDFRNSIGDVSVSITGNLRIGIIDSLIWHPRFRVSEAIALLTKENESVNVSIFSGSSIDLEGQLLDGRLHCALGVFGRRVEILEYEYLFDEHQQLYCGRLHPLFEKPNEEISSADIAQARYVGRDQMDLVDALRPPAEWLPRSSSRYLEGRAIMILSGCHVAYLPDYYAQHWVRSGEMRAIQREEFQRVAQVHLVKKRQSREPRALSIFLGLLMAQHRQS